MLVAELQGVISERARLIESLAAKHSELSAKAYAARLVLAHVEALRTVMVAIVGADAAAGAEEELSSLVHDACALNSASAAPHACSHDVELNWSPERAAALLEARPGDLTVDGVRSKLRALVALSGCLLP